MPDIPRQKLIEIVARFGPQVSEDAKRCEGLLRDYCNEHKREIVVLVAAISEGVTTELRGSKGNLPQGVLVERLALRLHDNVGFVLELCRWGVETWALALGLCQLTDLVSKPKINLPNDSLAQPPNSSADERKDRFRQFVREILSKGSVTEDDKVRVHRFRESLVISVVEARAIVGEVKAKLPPTNVASAAFFINSIGMKLVRIPKGSFMMGSPPSELGSSDDERRHEVTISLDYYLGAFEVTQAQYRKVMGNNPSHFQGAEIAERHPKTGRVVKDVDSSNYPVDQVSWNDAVEFCKRLSELSEEKIAGRVYRLPTEAEWEYACRAGSTTKYSFGDDEGQLGDYAWFEENSDGTTHPVGQKQSNAWGLYDMHGNVWEWCADWYGEYPKEPVTDPVGPAEGSDRVARGGNWGDEGVDCTIVEIFPTVDEDYGAAICRSAFRFSGDPTYPFPASPYGFRVALSSPEMPK